jgi:hypothetical protein
MKKTLALVIGLALAASVWAADDECAGWVSGESTRDGGAERLCTTTSTFTNIVEGAVTERSVGMVGSRAVTLKRIEVRSINCTACTIVVQTATGANAGTVLYSNNNLVPVTPEAGGAAYTDYANDVVDSAGVPTTVGTERRIYIRVYNGDAEATDVVVTAVWGS